MNIYELTGALKELHELIDEDNVEELAELEAKLLDELIPEKVDGYRRLIMTLHGEVHTIDAEIARLKARSDVRSKLIERLKTRLKTALETSGLKSFKTPLGTVSVCGVTGCPLYSHRPRGSVRPLTVEQRDARRAAMADRPAPFVRAAAADDGAGDPCDQATEHQ
jgi:hypothetical protein